VTTHLYPTSETEHGGAGRLTKVRAQAVSRRSCAAVARRLGLAERIEAAAPQSAPPDLSQTDSVLAEALEAVIGAAYLERGVDATAAAGVAAFTPEIEDAKVKVVDYKSSLQERLARRSDVVVYEVVGEAGPPHERTFEVVALVNGEERGRGSGRSKKDAEQAAARAALEGGAG